MAAEREGRPDVTNDGAHTEPVSPKRSRVKRVKMCKHVKTHDTFKGVVEMARE